MAEYHHIQQQAGAHESSTTQRDNKNTLPPSLSALFSLLKTPLTSTPLFRALTSNLLAESKTSGGSRGGPAVPLPHLFARRPPRPAAALLLCCAAAARNVAANPPPIARVSTRSSRPSMSFNRGSRLPPPTIARSGLSADSVRYAMAVRSPWRPFDKGGEGQTPGRGEG